MAKSKEIEIDGNIYYYLKGKLYDSDGFLVPSPLAIDLLPTIFSDEFEKVKDNIMVMTQN